MDPRACHPNEPPAAYASEPFIKIANGSHLLPYLPNIPVLLYQIVHQPEGDRQKQLKRSTCGPSCSFSMASMALECFSHSICRTLTAFAALSLDC